MKISGTGRFFHPKNRNGLAYNKEGYPVLNFTLSQSRQKGGRWENSNWLCVWWGNEENRAYLEKIASEIENKTKIYVSGTQWNRSWEYQGRKMYRMEITVEKFKIVKDEEELGDDLPL